MQAVVADWAVGAAAACVGTALGGLAAGVAARDGLKADVYLR